MNSVQKVFCVTVMGVANLFVSAQTFPVIVDEDDVSVTVKYKGTLKTITILDIVDAMITGKMLELPLPYTDKARKAFRESDEKAQINMSKLDANPFGEMVLENMKIQVASAFTKEPDSLKDFIDKTCVRK